MFSGIGVTLMLLIIHIVKKLFCKEEKNSFMSQVNKFNSHGSQIGTQNNYYNKGDSHDR